MKNFIFIFAGGAASCTEERLGEEFVDKVAASEYSSEFASRIESKPTQKL